MIPRSAAVFSRYANHGRVSLRSRFSRTLKSLIRRGAMLNVHPRSTV